MITSEAHQSAAAVSQIKTNLLVFVPGAARLPEGPAQRGPSGQSEWAAPAADRQARRPPAPCQGHHLPAHSVNIHAESHTP